MEKILVSVVYVNYKTAELTLTSIKSVIEQTKEVDCQIIVVDNDSGDDIETRLAAFKDVKLIKLSNNVGFGRGNNAALQFCNGDYIFFLNTDTVLINDAISILAHQLSDNPDYGQVGANLFHAEGNPNQSFLYIHTLMTEIRAEMPNVLKKNHYRPAKWFNFTSNHKQVGYISGAATMLRRQWLLETGGFDKDFFMYYEDMELSVRVRKSGAKVVNIPQAKICHLGGGASVNDKNGYIKRHKMLAESKYIYYRKVKNNAYAWFVHITLQSLYFIYATFASKNKRKLYKQLIVNDNEGFKR